MSIAANAVAQTALSQMGQLQSAANKPPAQRIVAAVPDPKPAPEPR